MQHREQAREQIATALLPSFRHGLNITLDPAFDFSAITPQKFPVIHVIRDGNAHVFEGSAVFSSPYASRLAAFFAETWKDDEDKNRLHYLNEAYLNDLVLVVLPSGSTGTVEISTTITRAPFISAVLILAEPCAHGTIILTKKHDTAGYCAETIRVIAQPESCVDVVTLECGRETSIAIEKRKARVHRDATVNWRDIRLATAYTKNDIISSLVEEGASSTNTVIYLARDNQKYDIFTSSRHDAPRTTSDIFTRGVLNDRAKALSRGLVRIGQNAAGSNGYEKQDALLISKDAEADAIPNLEIHNHDVTCSHGSTVGPIDPDRMFYLMSRGMSKDAAQKLVVEGYFTPVLDTFKDETLKERIRTTIIEALG